MPTRTAQLAGKARTLDVRPDRLDLRDFPFRPPVENLPPVFPLPEQVQALLPAYARAGLVLDQGQEGACTGFGLAAVINYLRFVQAKAAGGAFAKKDRVSPRMLYHLARMYDEWPGEDYEGSSCRGALRGWQRHGVCLESLWPYKKQFVRPKEGWEADAATRPLGVYYRVQKDAVVDLQSAIYQTGAVYVSGEVHEGWDLEGGVPDGAAPTHDNLPEIPFHKVARGGHAFALVGYNARGFILQNSWGPDWGRGGFAVLTYQDWITHGTDAWVLGLGVPVDQGRTPSAAHYVYRGPRQVAGPAGWFGGKRDPLAGREGAWAEGEAFLHTLVLGNNGVLVNRLPQAADGADAARVVALETPRWPEGPRRLMLYAHGGLNSEADALERARILGPLLKAEGLHPLFLTWKTGPVETLQGMLEDQAKGLFGGAPAQGFSDALADAWDRTLELTCQHLLAKAGWAEMKQNAQAAAEKGLGLDLLADRLKDLAGRPGGPLEIHLVGHSAGSFPCGHLLRLLEKRGLGVASCTLFAPACDLKFALDHYRWAVAQGVLPGDRFRIHVLTDQRERDDTVGPYRKSLLYLVSRALERWHKTPLLGLARAFDPACNRDWAKEARGDLEAWQAFFWGASPVDGAVLAEGQGDGTTARLDRLELLQQAQVDTGGGRIASAHGCFDNSPYHLSAALELALGHPPVHPLGSLRY